MHARKYSIVMGLAVLAVAAFAPQALAVTPEGDPVGEEFPVSATATSGESRLSTSSGTTISCSSGSGSGQATSPTEGEGSYLLHGCKEAAFGTNCTSAGQPAGTIKLETVTLQLVYLDEEHTEPGVLATPPESGVFAKLSCFGGLIKIEVKGNGVLGRIVSPGCEETSTASTVETNVVAHGVPELVQVEETGTEYKMTIGTETVATDWTVTGTSEEEGTLTCP